MTGPCQSWPTNECSPDPVLWQQWRHDLQCLAVCRHTPSPGALPLPSAQEVMQHHHTRQMGPQRVITIRGVHTERHPRQDAYLPGVIMLQAARAAAGVQLADLEQLQIGEHADQQAAAACSVKLTSTLWSRTPSRMINGTLPREAGCITSVLTAQEHGQGTLVANAHTGQLPHMPLLHPVSALLH